MKWILIAAGLYATTTTAMSATLLEATRLPAARAGCKDLRNYRTMNMISKQEKATSEAFMRMMLVTGECVAWEKGTEVFFMEQVQHDGTTYWCLRKRGETQCYWGHSHKDSGWGS
ncbi:hypothetical protein [Microvirga guangxiensis]|uniref:Uncharacterized protein n=1 Tax=Microvirga guangxiensis TaxID=549386 RepID=A0A1G5GQ78_9HYPH|nr:hypothetical protein [Microvirga guangxiensis]SCY53732.1 hypothetical protein SAMN02927923_01601 [Microvirga guangxiensis]